MLTSAAAHAAEAAGETLNDFVAKGAERRQALRGALSALLAEGGFAVNLDPFPSIRRVEAMAAQLPAFIDAAPENQPDAGP